MEMEQGISRPVLWLQEHGLSIVLVLVVAILAYAVWELAIKQVTRRIQSLDDVDGSELDKRTETIGDVLHSTGIVIIIGTAVLMILPELGIDITPVLASVGIAGLAAGLGAQTLVKDVISGIFVLIENQYTVGDTVTLEGVTGSVEEMTLRITAVRDIEGTLHIIPNGEIRQVANKSRDWSRAIVDVNVTYDEDIDEAIKALQAVAQRLQEEDTFSGQLLDEPFVTGVEGLEDWAIRLRLMVKTVPGLQYEVQRWLRRQIRLNFEQKQIDLAFPQQGIAVVYNSRASSPDTP